MRRCYCEGETKKWLSNALLLQPTGKKNRPNIKKLPRMRHYSNYRNLEQSKGLAVPRN